MLKDLYVSKITGTYYRDGAPYRWEISHLMTGFYEVQTNDPATDVYWGSDEVYIAETLEEAIGKVRAISKEASGCTQQESSLTT